MSSFIRYHATLFRENVSDIHARRYVAMGVSGSITAAIMAILNFSNNMYLAASIDVFLAISAMSVLIYSIRTKKYEQCFLLIISVAFFILLPILYFASGGYASGMPAFLLYAIVFTISTLAPGKALVFSILETILYLAICFISYIYPSTVTWIKSGAYLFWSVFSGVVCVSASIVIVIYITQFEYQIQRKTLEQQNQTLRHYDEMKNSFLTTVAHEIKNPLAAISIHTRDSKEILEEDTIDIPQLQENLKITNQIVGRINRILLDLMDTVSIEQGRLSLSLNPIYLSAVIQESARFYFDDNNINGNVLKLDIDENLPAINGDLPRLLQVLNNLISNADRHTKNGTITVSLRPHEKGQMISVSDTGSGMSEYMRNNALTGYVSASKDYWRHGIGLYVCNQIVTAHGGDIWIDSEVGKGTTISFVLPTEKEM